MEVIMQRMYYRASFIPQCLLCIVVKVRSVICDEPWQVVCEICIQPSLSLSLSLFPSIPY